LDKRFGQQEQSQLPKTVLLRHFRGTNLDSIEQKPHREMANLFSAQGARGELCCVFAITELCSQPIGTAMVFKIEIEKEGLPGDITPALGAGGPGSNPGAPTTNLLNQPVYRRKSNRAYRPASGRAD